MTNKISKEEINLIKQLIDIKILENKIVEERRKREERFIIFVAFIYFLLGSIFGLILL